MYQLIYWSPEAYKMTKNLTPRQRAAIQGLVSGQTITQVAVAAGVSRETIYKWLQRPDFTKALTGSTDAAVELLSRRLVGISTQALDALEDVLTDTAAPHSAKIRAAEIVLARLLNLRELVDIDARLTALEAGTK